MGILNLDSKITEAIGLASKYPAIKRIGIFGSYARGEGDTAGDIDLIYDYDEESERSTDDMLDYVDEIDEIIKSAANVDKIDYVWYEGVLRSKNENFRKAVLKDVIWLYENKLI